MKKLLIILFCLAAIITTRTAPVVNVKGLAQFGLVTSMSSTDLIAIEIATHPKGIAYQYLTGGLATISYVTTFVNSATGTVATITILNNTSNALVSVINSTNTALIATINATSNSLVTIFNSTVNTASNFLFGILGTNTTVAAGSGVSVGTNVVGNQTIYTVSTAGQTNDATKIAIQGGNGNGNTLTNLTTVGVLRSAGITNNGAFTNSGNAYINGGTLGIGAGAISDAGSGSLEVQGDWTVDTSLHVTGTSFLTGPLNVQGPILQSNITATRIAVYDANKRLTNAGVMTAGQYLTVDGSGLVVSNLPPVGTNTAAITGGTNLATSNTTVKPVFLDASGNQLRFLSLEQGSNAVLFMTPTSIVVNASSSGGSASLTGTTNFLQLSVQAAKLPTTNQVGLENGYQDWETIYYKTNLQGSIASLNGTWQFIVPQDYATNSLKVRTYWTLMTTNGPNTSNTICRVSVIRATPGDSTDLHTASFGTAVSGTNTWAASGTGTNKIQSVVINMSTTSTLAAGDLCILKVDRDAVNDTFGGTTALVGLQLEYTRR